MEHEIPGDTICNLCPRYSHERIDKGQEDLEIRRTNGDHPNDSIVKIDQNTEMGPGELRKLAAPQIPAKNHQLNMVTKTLKSVKSSIKLTGILRHERMP